MNAPATPEDIKRMFPHAGPGVIALNSRPPARAPETAPAQRTGTAEGPALDINEVRDIHEPLEKYLRERGLIYVRARSDRRSTICVGFPDFAIFKNNRCLLIEAKTPRGELSKYQVEVHKQLSDTGNTVRIARSYVEAREIVEKWISEIATPPVPSPSAPIFAAVLDYVVKYGRRSGLDRVIQVCEMALKGVDPRDVLRQDQTQP